MLMRRRKLVLVLNICYVLSLFNSHDCPKRWILLSLFRGEENEWVQRE